MKRYKIKIFLVLLAIFLGFPTESIAAESNFVLIESMESQSMLNKDGSLDVEERILYRAVGDIPYIRHDIDIDGTAEIPYESFEIEQVVEGESVLYQEDYSNTEGLTDAYSLGVGNDEVQSVDLFVANEGEQEYEFILRYTIENLGAIYYDSGRLHRDFIVEEIGYPILSWSIHVQFAEPEVATLYYFSPGSEENGKVAATEEGIRIQGGEIPNPDAMEVDIFFPQSVIADSLIYVPETAKEIQENRDEEIQSLTKVPEWLPMWSILVWILTAALALITFFVISRMIRDRKIVKPVSFHSQPPALIQATIDRVLTQRGLNATILDFIRRGMLRLGNDNEGFSFALQGLGKDARPYEASFYDHLHELSRDGKISTTDLVREAENNSQSNNAWIRALNKEIHDERKNIRLGSNYNVYRPVIITAAIVLVFIWIVFFLGNSWLTLIASIIYTIFFVVLLAVSLSPSPGTNEFYDEAEEERKAILSGKGRGSALKQWVNALVLRVKNDQGMALLEGNKSNTETEFIRFLFSKEAERLWFKGTQSPVKNIEE